ncbi:hypothetical protein PHMEG_00038744 [Phytophthora megakarya]|uniref:Uncharacterized protein n=1 Tax=Phytophthora megakarya TaxID=4795 RepID=A0A225UH98_9STRA|nr:hypothetical protein PHMEG_00038744 [Phytophthora megakarya]
MTTRHREEYCKYYVANKRLKTSFFNAVAVINDLHREVAAFEAQLRDLHRVIATLRQDISAHREDQPPVQDSAHLSVRSQSADEEQSWEEVFGESPNNDLAVDETAGGYDGDDEQTDHCESDTSCSDNSEDNGSDADDSNDSTTATTPMMTFWTGTHGVLLMVTQIVMTIRFKMGV